MAGDTLKLALDYLARNPTRYLFPLRPMAKFPPLVKNNLENASNDPAQIRAWHEKYPGCNWGLSLAKSNLFVVDTDRKEGKKGADTHATLEMLYDFPDTETVISPSNGTHEYYEGKHEFALGKYGLGVDIDSPNYVLIAGCTLSSGRYVEDFPSYPIAPAPEWFYELIAKNKIDREAQDQTISKAELDLPSNIEWAIDFLREDAHAAIQGQNGDIETVHVAAQLKDHAISKEMCLELMTEHYNKRCRPPWRIGGEKSKDSLETKVDNAYAYCVDKAVGEDTAEADFDDIDLPDNLPPETEKVKVERTAAAKLARPGEAKQKKVSLTDVMDEWVYVLALDRFIHREQKDLIIKSTAFDRFHRQLNPKSVSSLSDFLLSKPNRSVRKFHNVGFFPGEPEFMPDTFNFYRAPTLVPKEGDTSFWNAHLEYLFPDEESRNHVLNWCGWFVQNIKRKPKHAMIIAGYHQGTGKTFIPSVVGRIIGLHNTTPIGKSELKSDFNRWASRSKLLVVEELRAAGMRDISQNLHPLITEDRIPINDKGMPTYSIDNCFGLMCMTNHENALRLDTTDRRYMIVRTEAVPREQAYYDRMYGLLQDETFIAAVAHELMTRDLKGYNGQAAAPVTVAKKEMIKAGLTGLEDWLESERENAPFKYDLVSIQDDIMPIIPPALSNPSNVQTVAEFLRRQLRGRPFDMQHRLKGGRKVRLWALHGKYGLLSQQKPSFRVERYESRRNAEDDEFPNDSDVDSHGVEN